MKELPHLFSSGKCKYKQWGTDTPLLAWSTFGVMATLNAGEYVDQQQLSFIVDGSAKWCNRFGRQPDGLLKQQQQAKTKT